MLKTRESFTIDGIQSVIDFIEEIEGRGIALLDRKYKGQRNDRLLTARQLIQFLNGCAARKRDSNFDTNEIIDS